jgi:hypothetical protein
MSWASNSGVGMIYPLEKLHLTPVFATLFSLVASAVVESALAR